MFGVQFYPTPPDLVQEMLSLVDFSRVRYALEPSAGKGDIALEVKRRGVPIECVEIDADLGAVLRERGLVLVGQDFLAFHTHTRYDLIAMNPPFANGEQHLLHALELLKKGGQVVCIVNAATIRDAHTRAQVTLVDKLRELGATITYVKRAFAKAERKTKVEIALIYVNIPKMEEADVLQNLRESIFQGETSHTFEETRLAETDFIRTLVRQYEFECRAGLSAIDHFAQMDQYIPRDAQSTRIISLEVTASEDGDGLSLQNRYLLALRGKYWGALFASKEMQPLFTKDMRETYSGQLSRFRCYDFTMQNILQLRLDLAEVLIESVEAAIVKLFDQLGYENSMEKNGNIHYYSGWKTNKAYRVGQKVIFAVWGLYDSRWGGSWSEYKSYDTLVEIEKVFNYLDNGRTDGARCDDIIREAFRSANKAYGGEWIACKYFEVSLKKKGSVHLRFLDLELLKRFNIFGANKRNWLPPSYGTRRYEEFEQEERSVVDAFEGKAAYQKTLENRAFYLGTAGLLMLGTDAVDP